MTDEPDSPMALRDRESQDQASTPAGDARARSQPPHRPPAGVLGVHRKPRRDSFVSVANRVCGQGLPRSEIKRKRREAPGPLAS